MANQKIVDAKYGGMQIFETNAYSVPCCAHAERRMIVSPERLPSKTDAHLTIGITGTVTLTPTEVSYVM